MSIWTAVQTASTASAIFKERGLPSLAATSVSDLYVTAHSIGPYKGQFAKNLFNISDVLFATMTKKVVLSSESHRAVIPKLTVPLIEAPTMTVQFEGVSEEFANELRGYGMERDLNVRGMWHGSPTHESTIQIGKCGPKPGIFTPGRVGLDGYLAYVMAWKGVVAFGAVSQTAEMKSTEFIRIVADDLPNHIFTAKAGGKIPGQLENGEVFGDRDMDPGLVEDVVRITPSSMAVPLAEALDINQVLVGINHVPNNRGHVFPYFHGLVTPDKDYVYMVFSRLFTRSLADNASSAQRVLTRLRSGIRSLATLRGGMILSHVYLGIQLAIDSQSCFKVILHHNVYKGFILESPHAHVINRGMVLTPLSMTDMTKEIEGLDTHGATLSKITRLIRAHTVGGVIAYDIQPRDISTPRQLNLILGSLNDMGSLDDEDREKLKEMIPNLSFGEKYLEPTAENMTLFLNYCLTGSNQVLEGKPFYYEAGLYLTSDKIERGLAMFGPRVPSLHLGGNRTYTIPTHGEDKNLELAADGKGRNIPYFPFKLRPLKAAAQDWINIFISGTVFIPGTVAGRRGFVDNKKLDGMIAGIDHMRPFYDALKANVIAVKAMGPGNKGKGKRIRGMDDDDEDESSNRKRSKVIADDMDLFA